MSVTRHYFPGNNTPEGFFSYYDHILDQREAERIICIKGGPGTGKSTFMRRVGERLAAAGQRVDFLHCSADARSLDGIIAVDRRIAFIDGTSPHVVDPVTPGAVDCILNFGDFWDPTGFSASKEAILEGNAGCAQWYRIAYRYLAAARTIGDNLQEIHQQGIGEAEINRLADDLVRRAFQTCELSLKTGRVRRLFATAITHTGVLSHVKSLLSGIQRVYCINVPEGYENRRLMQQLLDAAVYRGLDVEAFYCPMQPREKLEHLLVPELSLAFVTTNGWHDLEPWEIAGEGQAPRDITMIDVSDYESAYFLEAHRELCDRFAGLYRHLVEEAVDALAHAKEIHDAIESHYIPNMNFEKIDTLVEKTVAGIV